MVIVSVDLTRDEQVAKVDPESLDHGLASHFKEKHTEDLGGLIERGLIRVLTTFNKTNYFLHEKKQYGFEYSLLRDYEKFLNRKVGKELKVILEFRPVSRDRLVSLLTEGHGDIAAAGLTITPKREKVVEFTKPYLEDISEVVVSHKDVDGLEKLEDLSGRELFVRESSSYYESIQQVNNTFTARGLGPVEVIKADESLETEDILELVNSGAVRITVSDDHVARIWAKVLDSITIHANLKLRTKGKIAWMIRKSNPELEESLNSFIKNRRQGTRIGNIYFRRYFEDNKWIKNPLKPKPRQRQNKYQRLFRKYAAQYGFDWMLIMSMAFQESGLDHKKRSRAGAVGIMQVRPSTARGKRIGIKDIHDIGNNIHAGVKYLALLRDEYFTEENISERDRIRMALAAYNAGPSNIMKARRTTRKMNLDDTRWFRNVEIATLKIIGQQPVEYVSNINKYYIIYKLDEAHKKVREQIKSDIK